MKELQDNELVDLVKQKNDGEALIELMERHSGIFHQIITDFIPPSLSLSQREDVFEEKPTFFYEAIRSYDESKKVKFSTWLANSARYKMLSKRTKEKQSPDFCELNDEIQGSTELSPDLYTSLKIEAEQALALVKEAYGEDAHQIFYARYFGGDNHTGETFSQIAKRVGVSPQAIQHKHANILAFLQENMA